MGVWPRSNNICNFPQRFTLDSLGYKQSPVAMPFYPGSVRSKKANRNSTGSIISMASHSTAKGSKPSIEKPKKERTQGQSQKTPSDLDSKVSLTESEKKHPNVFEYLDDETEDTDTPSEDDGYVDGRSSRAPSRSKVQPKITYPGPEYHISSTSKPSSNRRASIRSQTASVKSKGSEISPTTVPLQLANNRKSSFEETYNIPGSLIDGSPRSEKLALNLVTKPETYYPLRNTATSHRPPLPPSPPRSPEDDLHRINKRPKRNTKSSHKPSGYGLLASRLSSSTDSEEPHVPPLYRRFEDLNHRVLLHLQDEIAQMEEDLRLLDEYEEMHRVASAEQEGTKKLPASRRMDVQARVYSSLHYRRVEVMEALVHKIEQYNNALTAYSKVLQTLPPASGKDIDSYRFWMKENTPIVLAEMHFLDHSKDLVSLTRRTKSHSSTVYSAIIIASAAILLPLLAFSMISEFSGRLVVVALVGGAASAIATHYSTGVEQLVDARDGWRCAALYFGFMTIAALFIY